MKTLLAQISPQPEVVDPFDRSIHLVDLENLLGSSATSVGDVQRIRGRYDRLAGVGPADLLVIATGPTAAPAAWFGWGSARRLVGRGIDGADHMLIEVIEAERLAVRFDRVVIASGDGIFAEPCAALQADGCHVTVVARPGAVSARLRLAVRDIRFLYEVPPPAMLGYLRRAA